MRSFLYPLEGGGRSLLLDSSVLSRRNVSSGGVSMTAQAHRKWVGWCWLSWNSEENRRRVLKLELLYLFLTRTGQRIFHFFLNKWSWALNYCISQFSKYFTLVLVALYYSQDKTGMWVTSRVNWQQSVPEYYFSLLTTNELYHNQKYIYPHIWTFWKKKEKKKNCLGYSQQQFGSSPRYVMSIL